VPQKVKRTVLSVFIAGSLVACAGERPQDIGIRNGTLTPCKTTPNCVSSRATDAKHQIGALRFSGDPDAVFARLKHVLGRRSDTTLLTADSDYLQVEFRTTFFVDDGEFLLDREAGLIQIRSASRIGHSDLGKNRSRMEEIRREFLSEENGRTEKAR
jgi:uncharacterized protein (DUF1499 family)